MPGSKLVTVSKVFWFGSGVSFIPILFRFLLNIVERVWEKQVTKGGGWKTKRSRRHFPDRESFFYGHLRGRLDWVGKVFPAPFQPPRIHPVHRVVDTVPVTCRC